MSRAIHKMRAKILPEITATLGIQFDFFVAQNAYTFVGGAWASWATGRVVAVTVYAEREGDTSRTVNSVTIDGISTTRLDRATTATGGSTVVGIFAAVVPVENGNTGDIVVTFSAQMDNCAVQVTTLYDVQSVTPTFNGNASSNNASSLNVASVLVAKGGIVLGGGTHNQPTIDSTWTNLNQKTDSRFGTEEVSHAYSLESQFTSGDTVTWGPDSGSNRIALVVASLR